MTRSTRLLTDVTIRERTCDGQERHRFKTRVMEETVLDGQDQNSFLYELAFQNAQS